MYAYELDVLWIADETVKQNKNKIWKMRGSVRLSPPDISFISYQRSIPHDLLYRNLESLDRDMKMFVFPNPIISSQK